jgi:hypothetical protein
MSTTDAIETNPSAEMDVAPTGEVNRHKIFLKWCFPLTVLTLLFENGTGRRRCHPIENAKCCSNLKFRDSIGFGR